VPSRDTCEDRRDVQSAEAPVKGSNDPEKGDGVDMGAKVMKTNTESNKWIPGVSPNVSDVLQK